MALSASLKSPVKRSSKKVLSSKEVELKKGAGKVKKGEDLVEVSGVKFPEINLMKGEGIPENMFAQIPITVNVELGKTKMSLEEVLSLHEGSIIEIDRLAGEPLDLVVNGQLIAKGEVVAIDDNYGLRITEILAENEK